MRRDLFKRPPFEHEPKASQRPAMRDDEDALAGAIAKQYVKKQIHTSRNVGEALAAGRTSEPWAERVPVVLQPRKRGLGFRRGHVVGVTVLSLSRERIDSNGRSRP